MNLSAYINTPQRLKEFKQAIDRALNTWDQGPAWLFQLSDDIEAGKVQESVGASLHQLAALSEELAMMELKVRTARIQIDLLRKGMVMPSPKPGAEA